MSGPHWRRGVPSATTLICAALGAVTVAGFAPFGAFPLPIVTLATLLWLASRAPAARVAALRGFSFGLGYFLTGVSWVYVSLHDFGQMPLPVAAFFTFLFCAFLALAPAIVVACAWRWRERHWLLRALAIAAAWTLAEWVRGWIFTGFPWIALGYSQIPDSPLAGYAPVTGLYGVTFLTAFTAAVIATVVPRASASTAARLAPVAPLVLVWAGGMLLHTIEWTVPHGAPVDVSLLQGNVAQDLKWRPEQARATLNAYLGLVEKSRGRLIVLPETALPMFKREVPPQYLERLRAVAIARNGDVLVGMPEHGENPREYYNSVLSYGAAPTQTYRKDHLVPFGEFIPLRPVLGWIVSVLAIPLQDFSRGGPDQRPLAVAGERVAVNICYEDVFGEEIIRQLPEATMLVNVSNVAWFGRSIAPRQHLQISQARALEAGRPMLRATNTGMTAVIDPRGRVVAEAPEFETAIIEARVQGYAGATPFVRTGNAPTLVLCLLLVAACSWRRRA
ncbi:MAG: apolipoprotein N-acyltransferase [Burkholderiales bacterium]